MHLVLFDPQAVYWNDTKELVLLVCEDLAFVLKYEKDAVDNAISEGAVSPEVGVPGACESEYIFIYLSIYLFIYLSIYNVNQATYVTFININQAVLRYFKASIQ
jgi:hypothetical protein